MRIMYFSFKLCLHLRFHCPFKDTEHSFWLLNCQSKMVEFSKQTVRYVNCEVTTCLSYYRLKFSKISSSFPKKIIWLISNTGIYLYTETEL